MRCNLLLSLALLVALAPCYGGQFDTKLQARTISSFEAYVRQVEVDLTQRWDRKKSFLKVEEDPNALQKVMGGVLLVGKSTAATPLNVPDGLVHDWYGAVFVPHTTIARVLSVLQDFDHHSDVYPEVIRSRLLKRDGNDLVGYWRLQERNQPIRPVFDVTQEAHYQELSPSEWICKSYAKNIVSVEDAGSDHERVRAPGEGTGLLWRLYAYWGLKAVEGGVLAECRSVSLSRGIPVGLSWIIRPFLQSVPKNSMDSTLRNTRRAAGDSTRQL